MNTRLNIKKLDGNNVPKHEGAQGDRESMIFQVSNDDTVVDQRSLKDKQPKEKTNTDYLRSTQQCMKSGVAKHLGVAGIQLQNGLVDESNVTLFAKVTTSTIGFQKPIDMLGTSSVPVLQGVEFKVEPQEDHTFEVEPQGNVDHVAVACEVISKWKAGLKDDMDSRSDVYVLSNGCKKCSDDNDGYYWEYTPGMFIHLFLYIDDMVFLVDARLRSWLPRVCWIKQREMYLNLLEGHSILSLEGSLSGDYDVENNYVGMLDKFDRGLQTDVQVFVDFDYVMGRSITSEVYDTYGGCKGGYLAKGSRNRVRIRAKDSSGYYYRCIVKGYPWFEVPALVEAAAYRRFLI
ncbi:hypothetical protein Tco_0931634 [Tanacetum coccineum]